MRTIGKGVVSRIFGAALTILAVIGIAACGKTYGREEFSKMVMHKSPAEVTAAVGEPAWINDGKPSMWLYRNKTFDAAKKDDHQVTLTFAIDATTGQETVVDVRFE